MNRFLYARQILSFVAAFWIFLLAAPNAQAQANGKELFQTKCAACHTTSSQRLTGPGLEGVNSRRDKAWLMKWIKNAPEMVASGDSLAVALFNEFNKIPMLPFPDMTDADIEAILAYIDEAAKPAPATAAATGEKPSTAEQMKSWTENSEGLTATTIIPLIMLAILLIILWIAGQKIPGMD